MKIYKNLWAGYDSYFVNTNSNSRYVYGVTVHNANGKWEVSKSMKYYVSDIKKDREHFPVVGDINLQKLLIEAILKSVIGDKETKAFNRLADYEDNDKKGVWIPISCAVVFGGSKAQWGSQIAGYMCSECEEEVESDTDYQYCPYCGAKMSDYYCEVINDEID